MPSLSQAANGKAVPARIWTVLQNLEKIYGDHLVVDSLSASEVNFHVNNLTDKLLIASMTRESDAIFGGFSGGFLNAGCVLGPADFQILCATTPSVETGRGIWLRYLPNMSDRSDYLSGFWFY